LKPDEVRKMPVDQRIAKLEELRLELVKLRLQAKMGLLKDTARIRNIRKDIARILTIINQERKRTAK